jgi:membrane associated rhomboid family serine protease
VGFYNRSYQREGASYGGGMGPMGSIFWQQLTPVVKWLILANIGMFLVQMIFHGSQISIEYWLAAVGGEMAGRYTWLQVWRLVTFQFLHGSFSHLFFNMLTLFFFGHIIERTWGSRKFLGFYLFCGAFGGLVFLIGSKMTPYIGGVLVGASGGILGVLTAGAILYPQITVFLFPIPFPIRIRWLLAFYLIWYMLSVSGKWSNAGGDLCHLGGIAAAFLWVMGRPFWEKLSVHRQRDAALRHQQRREQLQYEIDRILDKVHQKGIHSLTRKEKQILQDATEQQRKTGE